MSLLSKAMEDCTIKNKQIINDSYGGFKTIWSDGAKFKAAFEVDNSIESLTAQAQGVTAIYTVTTRKAFNLQHHDVFRRESDSKIFRVKSDGDDSKTPDGAGLDMRTVTAEEWTLPDG